MFDMLTIIVLIRMCILMAFWLSAHKTAFLVMQLMAWSVLIHLIWGNKIWWEFSLIITRELVLWFLNCLHIQQFPPEKRSALKGKLGSKFQKTLIKVSPTASFNNVTSEGSAWHMHLHCLIRVFIVGKRLPSTLVLPWRNTASSNHFINMNIKADVYLHWSKNPQNTIPCKVANLQ